VERAVGIAFILVLVGIFLWVAAPAIASAWWGWFSREDAPPWLAKACRISLAVAAVLIGTSAWTASR